MSPKEIAEKIRDWSDLVSWKPQKEAMLAVADELDPPKPQRPEPGTVVRFVDGDLGIVANGKIVYVGKDGYDTEVSWRGVQEGGDYDYMPVHILADDEVAVKRAELLKLANGERLLEESRYDEGDGRC